MGAGDLIREARRREGLTQSALGRRLAVTQPSVARLEAAGDAVSVATLRRAVAALGCRLDLRVTPAPSSIDESLLVENLRLTPGERIARFERWAADVAGLHGLARRGHTR